VQPKLLLADDSVTIQRVIELTFADEDVQVVAVGDGQQAIDRVRTDRPDIVLADVGMPEVDGYEVAAFIKGDPQFAHIPVLLLTGAFEPIDEARARAVGCDGVLVKPFEPQMVISRVRDLLAGKRDPAVSPVHVTVAPPQAAVADGMGSLEDYFDRLDAALASKGAAVPTLDPVPFATPSASRPSHSAAPSVAAVKPSTHADLDLTGWNPSAPAEPIEKAAPSAPVEHRQPSAPSAVPVPAAAHAKPAEPAPVMSVAAAPPPAVPAPVTPVIPVTPISLEQAFAALLAAEQGQAHLSSAIEQAPHAWPDTVPDALIDAVVERVIARMGDEKTRAVVLDVAERLVREEIDRIKNAR
jgi:CheY-like chemotaxis protein